MALADQDAAKANFLREAAHLLAVSSPTAAAFLGSARNKLIEDADVEVSSKEADALCREVCGACGNVLIPGWSCKTSYRTLEVQLGKRGKNNTKGSAKPEKTVMYSCLRCHRETVQTLQQKPRRYTNKSKPLTGLESPAEVKRSRKEVENVVPKTANASSKQRQRARKGGLQAMLEKNKTQTASQGGFDLMDFAM
jgi:hypothetical protein